MKKWGIVIALFLLLPIKVQADTTFCAPWDADFTAKNPTDCTVNPDTNFGLTIDTTTKKMGAGSLVHTQGAQVEESGNIIYTALSAVAQNEGTIGFWIKSPDYDYYDFYLWVGESDDDVYNSMIYINITEGCVACSPGGFVRIQMDDDTYWTIIDDNSNPAPSRDTWHYYELNWLWNDAGGKTYLTEDGSIIYSSTAGNAKTRNASGYVEVGLNTCDPVLPDACGESQWLDDLSIWDAEQHVGSFSIPTSANCSCGAAAITNFINFGYPFGGAKNGFAGGFGR